MSADKRELTISWLESNRSNGFFDGNPEEKMDFNSLDDESIEWYYDTWVESDSEYKVEDMNNTQKYLNLNDVQKVLPDGYELETLFNVMASIYDELNEEEKNHVDEMLLND